jgi:hypothetical protein
MTIAQYLPQWLRSKLQKPAPPDAENLTKKNRQVLPTVSKPDHAVIRSQVDESRPAERWLWRI